MESFKVRFANILIERGTTCSKLSEKLNIPKSTLSNYVTGRMEPKADRLMKIAKVLDVSETWLMGYDVPMERKNPETAAEKVSEIESLFKLLSPEQQQTVIALIHQLAKK